MNKRRQKYIDWEQLEKDLRRLYRQLQRRRELAMRAIGAEQRICTHIDVPVVAGYNANHTLHIVRERHHVLTSDEDEEDNV